MSFSPRRAVVTGLGIISPLGNTPEALWDGLMNGRSGVAPVQSFPAKYLPTSFAGEARAFTGAIDDFGSLNGETKKAIRKGLKVMCRECQMGVAAAQRALSSSGFEAAGLDPERTGIVFGSDYMMTEPQDFTAGILRCSEQGEFNYKRWPLDGMPQLTPLWLLKYLPNMPASHVAIYNDMRGPNNSLTLREASANAAVGEAFRTITRGSADYMLAGATGTRVHPMKAVHSILQEEVAGNGADPTRASRPFDRKRSGMVLGEGAATIVLEELQTAQSRSAKIYAEVIGTGSSTVMDQRGVADRKQALVNSMRAALRDAGLTPADIDHLNAHGLSTRSGDIDEASAIKEVFGDRRVPVVAPKSHFGNLGAGSGVVELIASILALESGQLFPLLNYENPDESCPINAVREPGAPAGKVALNVNVTPQGQASAIVVRRFEG
jgi:3-oxoacyl-[acyl-carrier-protein] synthase II